MNRSARAGRSYVFISYSSRDQARVVELANTLQEAGVDFWRDGEQILGGDNYGPEIVRGIRRSSALLLMCSDSSLRSKNVKQEIQLAWKYDIPYLPVLLGPTSFPEQVEYWLEGSQWIQLFDQPESVWLPRLLESLQRIQSAGGKNSHAKPSKTQTAKTDSWKDLWTLARFTDQIWPVPAESADASARPNARRGLGAAQNSVRHGYRLGSRVRLLLELEQPGHVLLLDQGPENILYCLCPSQFAPHMKFSPGRWVFPQPDSCFDSFVVSGRPGREQLLAIVTQEPLSFDWMPRPQDPDPARVLDARDVEHLVSELQSLPPDSWSVISSYFDVVS